MAARLDLSRHSPQAPPARTETQLSTPAIGRTSKPEGDVSTQPPTKPKPRYVRVITEKRREQCRRSQSKYRRKQIQVEVDIEISVQRLRLELLQLEERRRSLYRTVNSRESSVHLLMEFCSVFRYGVPVAKRLDSSPAQRSYDKQLAFVTNHLHHSVRVDESRGHDVFMQQMRLFAAYYDDPLIELLHCSDFRVVESSSTMKAHQQLHLTVSQATIQFVFPHLQRPEHRSLRNKLLGARLRLPLCALFVFDAAGFVLELDWMIDFVGALQQTALTMDEVAIVLQQAQIVRDSYLIETTSSGGDVIHTTEKDVKHYEETNSQPRSRRNHRWYEDEAWRQANRQAHEYPDGNHPGEASNAGGYLIHDGKGDDYVMV